MHWGQHSTWVGGASGWDNLFCFGIRVCLVSLSAFAPACFTVLCLSTSVALCPAGWLRFRWCLHVLVACAAVVALFVRFRCAASSLCSCVCLAVSSISGDCFCLVVSTQYCTLGMCMRICIFVTSWPICSEHCSLTFCLFSNFRLRTFLDF